MKFSHVALSVMDIETSVTFYQGVFGLSVRAEATSRKLETRFVQLQDEHGVFVELFQHERPHKYAENSMDFRRGGIKHISFEVQNLEEAMRLVIARGGSILREIRPGKTVKRNVFVSDPDGIAIELVEL